MSLLEHGVYTLLLDRYYGTEKGIPADQAYRLCRAREPGEMKAVDAVLAEFFVLVDGVWMNNRVEEEIASAQIRIDAARENGKKGGRPKKNPVGFDEETQEKPNPNPTLTQQKAHQAPDTSINSVANATGGDAPAEQAPDPIWGTGLAFLIRKGIPKIQARSLLGKLRKTAGDVETGALLAQAEADDITDPAPWLMACAKKAKARAGPGTQQQPMGKTAQALMALEAMKNGNLDSERDFVGTATAPVLELGADASRRIDPAHSTNMV